MKRIGRRYGREKGRGGFWIREILIWFFLGAIMVLLAFAFVYLFGIRTNVVGDSMEPELHHGEEVFIDRLRYLLSEPKRNDVVVFRPNGNPNAHYYIKRIVGLPGETVQITDGILYINGEMNDDQGFGDHIDDGGIASTGIKLGKDEYFVLGDNRNDSEDSRSGNIGMVHREYMIGCAWFRVNINERSMGVIE